MYLVLLPHLILHVAHRLRVNGSGVGECGGRALEHATAAARSGRASPPLPGVPDRPSSGGAPWRGAGATPELPRGQQGAARAQGVRMRMLARVHRLVQVLDPLLDGGEVLGLGELDEVGRLAH